MSRRLPTLTALAAAASLLVATPAAHATFPGANGEIMYASAPFKKPDSGSLRIFDPTAGTDSLWVDNKSYDEYNATFSPDGKTLVWNAIAGGKYDGLIIGPSAGGTDRLLVKTSDADDPAWSPDGSTIAFIHWRTGLQTIPAAGGKPTTIMKATKTVEWAEPAYVSTTSIVFTRYVFAKTKFKRSELWTAAADGSAPRLLYGGTGDMTYTGSADVSPDGMTLIFTAGAKMPNALYAVPVAGGTPTKIFTAPKGRYLESPVWSPDGSRIVLPLMHSNAKRPGSSLITFSPSTGVQRVLKSSSKVDLYDPTWQPIR